MNKRKLPIGAALLNAPFTLWIAIFVLAPLVLVAYFAFTGNDGRFSLEWFEYIFHPARRETYLRMFGDSLLYGATATAISLLLAFPLAHFMAQSKPSVQRVLMLLIMVPMWMNFLIATIAWQSILEYNSGLINNLLAAIGLPRLRMINTPGAAILGMVYNFVPFMILPIYTVMARLNVQLVEAAQDLGASRWQVLRRVIVPLSMPGVMSGIVMVFVPSVSVFFINDRLGGVRLIGDVINQRVLNETNLGAAFSLILMLMILVCMLVLNRMGDREKGAFVT
ncbi:MAG: ABC transporter permease [Oscillospiraceae bacterium]|nr:ABC transporter permease [Oscillospiraceae bacterium]